MRTARDVTCPSITYPWGEYPIPVWGTPSWGTPWPPPPPPGTGVTPGKGPRASHWGTPRKVMGPVEVLWDGDGVPPGKDMGPVAVLWDGDGIHPPPPGAEIDENYLCWRALLYIIGGLNKITELYFELQNLKLCNRTRNCSFTLFQVHIPVLRERRSYFDASSCRGEEGHRSHFIDLYFRYTYPFFGSAAPILMHPPVEARRGTAPILLTSILDTRTRSSGAPLLFWLILQ